MPPKRPRRKKLSKEEIEEQRLAQEAEEQRLREEEEARQREEAAKLAAEAKRLREEESARRAAELTRLDAEFPADVAVDRHISDELQRYRAETAASLEWAEFMRARDLPEPGSDAEVNTFIAELEAEEEAAAKCFSAPEPRAHVMDVAARLGRAEAVARALEDEAASADDEQDVDRASRARAFSRRLRRDAARRLDEATAWLLEGRSQWQHVVREQAELSAWFSTGQGVGLGVWANLAGHKLMRAGRLEVPQLGIRVAMSRSVSKLVWGGVPTAVRAMVVPYDNASDAAELAAEFAKASGLSPPPCSAAEEASSAAATGSRAASASRRGGAAAAAAAAVVEDGEGGDEAGEDTPHATDGGDDAAAQEAAGDAADPSQSGADGSADDEEGNGESADAGEGTEAAQAGADAAEEADGTAATGIDSSAEASGEGESKDVDDGDVDAGSDGEAGSAGDAGDARNGEEIADDDADDEAGAGRAASAKTVAEARPAPRERSVPSALPSLDEPVSGLLFVEVLAMPVAPRVVKGTTLIRETALSRRGVHRLPHPMQGGGMSQALTVTVAVPPLVLAPPEIRAGYWSAGKGRWVEEPEAPPPFLPDGTRELQLKTTFMTALALLQPRTVDLPFRGWSLRPLDSIRAAVLDARERLTSGGFAAPGSAAAAAGREDYAAPVGRSMVSRGGGGGATPAWGGGGVGAAAPLGPAPLSPEDLAAAGGWDAVAKDTSATPSGSHSGAGDRPSPPEMLPTTSRVPVPEEDEQGVLVVLDTARIRVSIAVGRQAAWLLGPVRREFAHLLGVGLRPGVLLLRLRQCGLRVAPDLTDADFPSVAVAELPAESAAIAAAAPGEAPKPKRTRQLIPKELRLEVASHRQLARLGCAAVVVPSAWNQRCPDAEFHAVVRVREPGLDEPSVTGHGDPAAGGFAADAAVHPTSWRTTVGGSDTDAPAGVRWWLARTQESADAFDAAPTKGSLSSNTMLGALGARVTAECAARAAEASPLLVDAVECMLRRFRLLSFAQ